MKIKFPVPQIIIRFHFKFELQFKQYKSVYFSVQFDTYDHNQTFTQMVRRLLSVLAVLRLMTSWLERKSVHKQQEWSQPSEGCRGQSKRDLRRASRGVDWSWFDIKPLLNQRQHLKRQSPLFTWKSSLHFIWESESQSLEGKRRGAESRRRLKSSMKFLQSVMVSGSMSSAGVNWFAVFYHVQSQQSSSYTHLLTSFVEMRISISSRTLHLPAVPKPRPYGSVTVLLLCLNDQPAHLSFNPTERKMRNTQRNNIDKLLSCDCRERLPLIPDWMSD